MSAVIFSGPSGRLEGHYHHNRKENAPIALILHPSPQEGGSMDNRVTYTMYRILEKLGFSVLRYNSRGVGHSQGEFDGGVGELSDAASALDWLQSINPECKELWIVGYSFGAFVGMQLLMRRPEITHWISIAPPVSQYDFGFLAPCPCDGLMISAEKDEIVPLASINKLVDKLNTQKNVNVTHQMIANESHTFMNNLVQLVTIVTDYVGSTRLGCGNITKEAS